MGREKWAGPPSICVPVVRLENVRDWSALIIGKARKTEREDRIQ